MELSELNKCISGLTGDLDFCTRIYTNVSIRANDVLDILSKNNFNLYNIVKGQHIFKRGNIYIILFNNDNCITRSIKITNKAK